MLPEKKHRTSKPAFCTSPNAVIKQKSDNITPNIDNGIISFFAGKCNRFS